MKRILALTGGLVLTFSLLMVGVRAIGAMNKSPAAAILDPGDCPQPCWHGIQPGKTTLIQAKAVLDSNKAEFDNIDYSDGQKLSWHIISSGWTGYASNAGGPTSLIMSMTLSSAYKIQSVNGIEIYSGDFRLGEALILLGDPVTFRKCTDYARLFYANNISVVVSPWREARNLDPQWVVTEIGYDVPYDEVPFYSEYPRWKGFISADVVLC